MDSELDVVLWPYLQCGFAVPDTSVGCDNVRASAHLLHHQLGIKVKRAKRLPRNNSPGGVYCVAETKDKWFPF